MLDKHTDRELWRSDSGDTAIKLIAGGEGIGIRCGNLVVVKTAVEWHRLARLAEQETAAWLIRYMNVARGQRETVVHRHNAVADYWEIDPSATSSELIERSAGGAT